MFLQFMRKQYYVYVLASKNNGTLYIGITSNLIKRVFEHKNKCVEGFTGEYDVDKLMYFEIYGDVQDAITREKCLKRWKREWKINLIRKENPDWKDLY